jgi:hypothetical protein
MKSGKLFFRVFLLGILATSCREIIPETFPEFTPVPTINAYLIEGDTLKVNVSLAEKVDTQRLGFVEDANVDLYVNDEFAESLVYVDKGIYQSGCIVQSLNKYTCKVTIPGFDTIICEQVIPALPIIKGIEHINTAGKDEEGTSYPALKVTFKNNMVNVVYYEVEIILLRGYSNRIATIHTIVDPVILNEGLPISLFSNELIKDSVYTLYLNYSTGNASSFNNAPLRTTLYPFVVELRQVSEDYYRFKKQLYLYENGLWSDGIINSMTNTNIYSNIENGYGIFAGYSTAISDTITPNLDGYYD